ncbi:MAG: hypothetical protein ACFFCW_06260 [Candidatus Hodarchaeota archaeon]
MSTKTILYDGIHTQKIESPTVFLESNLPISNLSEFGEIFATITGTQILVLGEEHIRIPTPQTLGDNEIHRLRALIINLLHLPVTIFREKKFIEIKGV